MSFNQLIGESLTVSEAEIEAILNEKDKAFIEKITKKYNDKELTLEDYKTQKLLLYKKYEKKISGGDMVVKRTSTRQLNSPGERPLSKDRHRQQETKDSSATSTPTPVTEVDSSSATEQHEKGNVVTPSAVEATTATTTTTTAAADGATKEDFGYATLKTRFEKLEKDTSSSKKDLSNNMLSPKQQHHSNLHEENEQLKRLVADLQKKNQELQDALDELKKRKDSNSPNAVEQ